jgi:asparagine synthase (glutamine-hydrolysing)
VCGIAGTVGFGDDDLIKAMTDAIAHRGPDGEGFFVGDGVCLGNRRLAILDVAGGSQPMTNEDGSVVVVYNGEIYNYRELKRELEAAGVRFRTTSDTEVSSRPGASGAPPASIVCAACSHLPCSISGPAG